jgi:hypothetical protein
MSAGSAFSVKGEERDGTHTHHKKKPMKKNIKSTQSSVPVQHSHTVNTPTPKPEPKADNRLPIDAEARKANRKLTTAKVVEQLATIPTAAKCAQVVGAWVWVQFAEQPAAEVRQQLAQLGFHWNRTRQAWQHPCGKFSTAAKATDPRDTYTSKPALEAYA